MSRHSIRNFLPKVVLSIQLCIFSCLLSGMAVAESADCTDKELVHGWGGDWEPFVMGTPAQPSGLDMDILDVIVKEAGCSWRNTEMAIPWARHLKMISDGNVDLATAASWTKERAQYAHYTLPYRTESVAIFILKENFDKFAGQNFIQLKKMGFRLGVPRGDYLGETMGDFVKSLGKRVYTVGDNGQNLKKLLLKRIDGFVGHIPPDSLYIQERGHEDKVVMLPGSVHPTGDIHIMISQKSRSSAVLDKLNQAIKKLKNNGTLDRIKAKYSKQFNTPLH